MKSKLLVFSLLIASFLIPAKAAHAGLILGDLTSDQNPGTSCSEKAGNDTKVDNGIIVSLTGIIVSFAGKVVGVDTDDDTNVDCGIILTD